MYVSANAGTSWFKFTAISVIVLLISLPVESTTSIRFCSWAATVHSEPVSNEKKTPHIVARKISFMASYIRECLHIQSLS